MLDYYDFAMGGPLQSVGHLLRLQRAPFLMTNIIELLILAVGTAKIWRRTAPVFWATVPLVGGTVALLSGTVPLMGGMVSLLGGMVTNKSHYHCN